MAGIGSYRNKGSFPGWIRRIVANETINRIKSESRLKLVTEETNFEPESENLFDHNWLSACRDLDNLLSHLSVTARAVLLLHEVEGYSHFEIAQLYEKSESFSKVTLSRAYNKLRQVAQEQDKSYALNR